MFNYQLEVSKTEGSEYLCRQSHTQVPGKGLGCRTQVEMDLSHGSRKVSADRLRSQYRGSSSPNSDSTYIPVKGKARSSALQGGWGQHKHSKKLKEIETFAFLCVYVLFLWCWDQSQDPISF